MQDNKKNSSIGVRVVVWLILLASIAVITFFVLGLLAISFQSGEGSARITQTIAYRVGVQVLREQPTMEQIVTINRMIRYSAHIGLFAFLGYMLGIVLFLINRRRVTRLLAIIIDWAVTFFLSYYTEYYKQFIAGRHFQMEDVRANMMGSLFGICFFIISFALFEAIHSRALHND